MNSQWFCKKLTALIKAEDWDSVKMRLRSDWGRFEARQVHATSIDGKTALHLACKHRASLSIVKQLIELFPGALEEKCGVAGMKKLPLHIACERGASVEVIEALCFAYPNAMVEKNSSNQIPLDLAIRKGASEEVIASLELGPGHYIETKDQPRRSRTASCTDISANPPRPSMRRVMSEYAPKAKVKDRGSVVSNVDLARTRASRRAMSEDISKVRANNHGLAKSTAKSIPRAIMRRTRSEGSSKFKLRASDCDLLAENLKSAFTEESSQEIRSNLSIDAGGSPNNHKRLPSLIELPANDESKSMDSEDLTKPLEENPADITVEPEGRNSYLALFEMIVVAFFILWMATYFALKDGFNIIRIAISVTIANIVFGIYCEERQSPANAYKGDSSPIKDINS